jgi:hypothetical protein
LNFSVHFDDETVTRLNQAAARVGLTRNRVIVTAVQDWLRQNEEKDWPETLKAHFRNPAPELAEQAFDLQSWRPQGGSSDTRW